jgi:hypothetical protein
VLEPGQRLAERGRLHDRVVRAVLESTPDRRLDRLDLRMVLAYLLAMST